MLTYSKASLNEDDLNALKDCPAKDFVLLLSEHATSSIDFSKVPLTVNDIFKTKEDAAHFGLLGKAELWIPKACEADFKDWSFTRNKNDDNGNWVSFSVLPQSVGI